MPVMAAAQTVGLRHSLVCRSCAGGRGARGLEGADLERVPCLARQAGRALRVPITRCHRFRLFGLWEFVRRTKRFLCAPRPSSVRALSSPQGPSAWLGCGWTDGLPQGAIPAAIPLQYTLTIQVRHAQGTESIIQSRSASARLRWSNHLSSPHRVPGAGFPSSFGVGLDPAS
jgi:hypothetical protein